MKKIISILILFTAFSFVFVSCKHNTNEEGNTTNQGGSGAGSGSGTGGNSNPYAPKDRIKIGERTYEYTGEVQLMTAPATVTGSDDYNLNSTNIGTGAFPAGRTVTLSPFIMGKYEVTQELYEAVMTGQKVTIDEEGKDLNAKPSGCNSRIAEFKNMLSGEETRCRPVESVTWFDACYFCNALSEKLGLTKAYNITVTKVTDGNITGATVEPVKGANGYRLPTEAEWEYAARGGAAGVKNGTFTNYWSGATTTNYSASENDDINGVAWYYYNASNLVPGAAGYGTHQVGKKAPNAAGLCDMSGNVSEWCYDKYGSISIAENVTDPSGSSEVQTSRVRRGGGWCFDAKLCAVSYRSEFFQFDNCNALGFRVVRNAQ